MFTIITATNNKDDNIKSFHQAVQNNNYDLVQKLIKVVDINSPDKEKCPPLYYAITNKAWEMVQLLIENGPKLNVDDKDEWNCCAHYVIQNILHHMVADLNVETSFIEFTLSQSTNGIDHMETSFPYRAPILASAEAGSLRILKYIITKYKPNVHVKCKNGQNLFHYAIRSKDKCTLELIQYIHSLGVDINHIDNTYNLPLTNAINVNLNLEIIQQFVEYGAIIRSNIGSSLLSDLINITKRDENDYQLLKLIFPIIIKQYPNQVKQLLFAAVDIGDITLSKYIVENYRSELKVEIPKGSINSSPETDLLAAFFQDASTRPRGLDVLVQFEQFRNKLQLFEYLMENGIVNGFFNFKKQY